MRVKRMLISPELLMNMGSGEFRVVAGALPEDAVLKQTTIDPYGGWVTLFIESKHFEEIEVGAVAPMLPAPHITRITTTEQV